MPATLGALRVPNRIALAPWRLGGADGGRVGDPHLVFLGSRAAGGVGLVMTETIAAAPGGDDAPAGTPRIGDDDQTVAWRRVVEFVHGGSSARIGAQLAGFGAADGGVALAEAAQRAGFAGFDLLVVHLCAGWLVGAHRDAIGDAIGRVRDLWPADRTLGVRVVDPPSGAGREAMVGLVEGLIGRGVGLAWVAPSRDAEDAAEAASKRRSPRAAPLADWIRNELEMPTVLEGAPAQPADLDALIAAGRCDLCALDRPLVVDPGFVQRAAEAVGWESR